MNKPSVSIVGGGPAGCSAGIFLAKQGFDNIKIYEKWPEKRKACAGGLTWKLIKRYKKLLSTTPLNPIKHCKFDFDNKKFEFSFRKPIVYVTDRLVFDKNLRELVKSYNIKIIPKKVDINELKDQLIIDARGFVGSKRVASSFSTICRFKNSVFTVIYNRKINPLGYFWVFPMSENYANVGIVGVSNTWSAPMAKVFEMYTKRYKLKILEKSAAPISLDYNGIEFGYKKRNSTILRVGEAARLVNPINGEGIFYAILSSELAVESLLSDEPIHSYELLVKENILNDFHLWEKSYNSIIRLPIVVGVNFFKFALYVFNRTKL